MLKTIHGVYRNGNIELREKPAGIHDDTVVIVTFLELDEINLKNRGIDKTQAAELRARLSTFAEDWESPEMDIYDNYDAIKSKL